MPRKVKAFVSGFLIAAISISAICGLVAVDILSGRYMPGVTEPMFLISNVGPHGVDISFMGQRYSISASALAELQQSLWPYRTLLPRSIRMSASAAARVLAG